MHGGYPSNENGDRTLVYTSKFAFYFLQLVELICTNWGSINKIQRACMRGDDVVEQVLI